MGIKRYIADADTTITNAFRHDLREGNRATGSNMGASDVMEVFSVFNQGPLGQYTDASSGSVELSRALIKFPISEISTDRTNSVIPGSGSVQFYLRMYNAKHSFTLPVSSTVSVVPVSQSWEEGTGLDMEEYLDKTRDGIGANWINASNGTKWVTTGATATLTFVTGDRPEAGDTITIIDTAGTEKAYLAAASQDLTTDPPKWHASNTTTTQVDSLQACIESENGHNGTITVSQDGTGLIMTLTQATAGTAGNRAITVGGATSGQLTTTDFAGGTDPEGTAFHIDSPAYTAHFAEGNEDIEIDISQAVESWIAGTKSNHGLGIYLTSSLEGYFSSSTGGTTGSVLHNLLGSTKSYYTKKFFSRGSEYFFKRPCVEARWYSAKKDDRGSSYVSSSLASKTENLNTIFLYNNVRGQLRDLPDVGGAGAVIFVQLYTSASNGELIKNASGYNLRQTGTLNICPDTNCDKPPQHALTGGYVSTGIYSCSFAVNTTASVLYDRWFSGSSAGVDIESATVYYTGSVVMNQFSSSADNFNPNPKYATKITNLKDTYSRDEIPRFRVFVREKDWSPNVYTVATKNIKSSIINKAYFKIIQISDDSTIIPFGTGSVTEYTSLSYDSKGNYFDLDMDLFEAGYAYGIKLAYYVNGAYHEQSEVFKFRVE